MIDDKKTPPLFWLYDIRSRPQYLAFGDYTSLFPTISFFEGLRRAAEKTWLSIQTFYPRHFVEVRPMLQSWKKIFHDSNLSVKGALFWRTDWYKNTLFIGGILSDDRRLFVKAYKSSDDAVLALQQTHFMQHYFSDYFTTVPAADCHDNLIFFPLLPHKKPQTKKNSVLDRIIATHKHHYDTFAAYTKPALDYINLNLPSLLQKNGSLDLWRTVRKHLQSAPLLPTVPVHGDLTPWNMFHSDASSPVIVDYERAGWHVPFYDCWHFQWQPIALHGKMPSVLADIRSLQAKTHIPYNILAASACLYLLDQLAHDLEDRDDYPQQRKRLDNVIAVKIRMVETLIQHGYNG